MCVCVCEIERERERARERMHDCVLWSVVGINTMIHCQYTKIDFFALKHFLLKFQVKKMKGWDACMAQWINSLPSA